MLLLSYIFQVIQRMSREKQTILANSVKEIVASLKADEVATVAALVAGDVMLKRRIVSKIVQTVEQQANVRVTNFKL